MSVHRPRYPSIRPRSPSFLRTPSALAGRTRGGLHGATEDRVVAVGRFPLSSRPVAKLAAAALSLNFFLSISGVSYVSVHPVPHICEHRDRAGTDLALQSGTGIRSLNLLVAVGWWVEEGNGVLMSHEAILVSLSQALSLCMHTHTHVHTHTDKPTRVCALNHSLHILHLEPWAAWGGPSSRPLQGHPSPGKARQPHELARASGAGPRSGALKATDPGTTGRRICQGPGACRPVR